MTTNPIIEPELVERVARIIDPDAWRIADDGGRAGLEKALDYSISRAREVLSLPELTALQEKVRRLEEALTPSAATKAAYIGEFSFLVDEQVGDAVCEVTRKVSVPWTTIKEIMAAIRERALNGSPDQ